MAKLLSGVPVSEALCDKIRAATALLRERDCVPTLEIVRVGERPEDLAYERGFVKRAKSLGIAVSRTLLPQEVEEAELIRVLQRVNGDPGIHGCLLFRPLPDRLNTPQVLGALAPEKDIDAITGASMGGLMVRDQMGFPPCTATACMELLRYYQVELKGRNVVMVGSGATVGLPTAILLMNQGATVSVCNVFTDPQRMAELCRGADVILSAVGKAGLIGPDHVRPGQVVVDVGVSPGPDGKLRGDVAFDQVEPIVAALTPMPGGVGAVTSTVLAAHTVEAALRAQGLPHRVVGGS
jgi:methylenetetrahydrofolate dehydrogenase (NADP+)/methenyltetrahydrofolate cyclohydrolase